MTLTEKANALVEMGLVRLTAFDLLHRLIGAETTARNLDVAQVRYHRTRGMIFVGECVHKTPAGGTHECEGHHHGHVCYHARAGLQMAAAVAGATITFHDTEAEAKGRGGPVAKVMVSGHDNKAVYAAYVKQVDKTA